MKASLLLSAAGGKTVDVNGVTGLAVLSGKERQTFGVIVPFRAHIPLATGLALDEMLGRSGGCHAGSVSCGDKPDRGSADDQLAKRAGRYFTVAAHCRRSRTVVTTHRR